MTEHRQHDDRPIDDRMTVSLGVPSPDDLLDLAADNFHTVVDFRTADETETLPPAEEERLAHQVGLNYVRLPVTAQGMNSRTVDRFRDVLRQSEPKIYVHCSAGGRAASVAMSYYGFEHGLSPDETARLMHDLGLPGSDEFVRTYVGERLGH